MMDYPKQSILEYVRSTGATNDQIVLGGNLGGYCRSVQFLQCFASGFWLVGKGMDQGNCPTFHSGPAEDIDWHEEYIHPRVRHQTPPFVFDRLVGIRLVVHNGAVDMY